MTEKDANAADAQVLERVRPLVNEILERFNRDNLSPEEAGMVILALTHRLMTVLEEAPEARRFFIMRQINLINNVLAEMMKSDTAQTCSPPEA